MSASNKSILIVSSILLFLGTFLYGLGDALLPLLFSVGLAYLTFPVIRKLEKKGIDRSLAVGGVFFCLILLFGLVLAVVLPGIVSDSVSFYKELPSIATKAAEKVESTSRDFGIDIDLSKESLEQYFTQHSDEIVANMGSRATRIANNVFSGFMNWLLSILSLFLVPLFFFYVINDFEKISSELKSFIPKSLQPKIKKYIDKSNTILSGYIRGQLLVALILGILYAFGLSLIGLKFGFLIGLISGLISFIPYAGFTIGFATALMVALADSSSIGVIGGIVLIYGAVQALEGIVITPKLVGDKVGLSPLPAMLALIVGGNLLGFTGMILGIPFAAIAKTVLLDLKIEYQKISG